MEEWPLREYATPKTTRMHEVVKVPLLTVPTTNQFYSADVSESKAFYFFS